MADFYGSARSNTFFVKDGKAFLDAVGEKAPDVVIEVRQWRRDGDEMPGDSVSMYSAGEYGTWPSYHLDADDNDVEIDWPALVSGHLCDGQVCVMMECGAEKLRYLNGWACAIHSDGRVVSVSLNDIYEKAAAEFDVKQSSISTAEY